jgi:hypothetical protein
MVNRGIKTAEEVRFLLFLLFNFFRRLCWRFFFLSAKLYISPIAFAISSSLPGIACPYKSKVCDGFACPSLRLRP